MNDILTLTLTADEAEILLDALETDLEAYQEATDDARAGGAAAEVAAFEEASNRIKLVMEKVRAALPV